MTTTATTEAAWPADTVARFLTLGGAAVNLRTHTFETHYTTRGVLCSGGAMRTVAGFLVECEGCGTRLSHRNARTDGEPYLPNEEAEAIKDANDHAAVCRAMPRSTLTAAPEKSTIDSAVDKLVARYGEDIAFLAGGHSGPVPIPAEGLTLATFADLVQDAADHLESYPSVGLGSEADDLAEAASRLRAALDAQADHQDALLTLAAKLLPAATDAAQELRLAG
ncbi:hypothetical protein [Kitasatospora sp. NPDC090091]|uniref:hypothetical protein n=1 Tax=Kitasatospora sp. NPDC090091 TaxID=3364081 RepID=UPI00380F7F88